MENEAYIGLPTMCLLPINKTRFKVVKNLRLEVVRKGSYHELSPKIFDKDSGDFNLLDNDVLYIPSITKVLLAEGKYPELKENQIFSPLSLTFTDETVIIEGMILEIINIIK